MAETKLEPRWMKAARELRRPIPPAYKPAKKARRKKGESKSVKAKPSPQAEG